MMLTHFAKVLGIILLVVGILGFIPGITPNHMLMGIFMVDSMHNIVHIVSGLLIAAVGFSDNFDLTRKVLLLFAVIYGLVTIIGFIRPDGAPVLGMHMNLADDILHLAITVATLLVALPQRTATLTR